MDPRDFYREIGASYSNALRRLSTDERISKYLRMFLDDTSFLLVKETIENKDYAKAFRAIHTLKGLCLNLELTPLANASCELTEYLRQTPPEELNEDILHERYDKVDAQYHRIRMLLE
ncbi:MAG: Hpt domain-containing protein [Muricomes sp.]